MAAFNLNQQQTPSQSCIEISVRAHSNETERENSVASVLSTGQCLAGTCMFSKTKLHKRQ